MFKRIEGLAWLIFILALSVASLASANENTGLDTDHAMPGHATEGGPFGFLTSVKGVYQTQVLLQSDGSLLLV